MVLVVQDGLVLSKSEDVLELPTASDVAEVGSFADGLAVTRTVRSDRGQVIVVDGSGFDAPSGWCWVEPVRIQRSLDDGASDLVGEALL